MTRLIPASEVTHIPNSDTKLFFTKEDYSNNDVFIAQDGNTETKYVCECLVMDDGIKKGYSLFILKEPTPSN